MSEPSRQMFEALVLTYREDLLQAVARVSGDGKEAEALVRKVYSEAWQTFDHLKPGTNCRAWLFSILARASGDVNYSSTDKTAGHEAIGPDQPDLNLAEELMPRTMVDHFLYADPLVVADMSKDELDAVLRSMGTDPQIIHRYLSASIEATVQKNVDIDPQPQTGTSLSARTFSDHGICGPGAETASSHLPTSHWIDSLVVGIGAAKPPRSASFFEIEDVTPAKVALDSDELCGNGFPGIVGNSAALRRVLDMVRIVAPTDATVLIKGETGTGKELIAEAIHRCSDRSNGPFVKVNCAAIPPGLLESELFGHERGAYTGAVARGIGRFERADRGTLFLDEIGDLPVELQPKLLRVIQERQFERLGSTATIHTDVRVICATHRNLSEMIEERQFRADLFYRLSVFPIELPPLRERPEDILLLVHHFAMDYAARMRKRITAISEEFMTALVRHSWPGNVRELQNFIERSVILSTGDVLSDPLHELTHITSNRSKGSKSSAAVTLEEAERSHILQTLEQTEGIVGGRNGAAARLGLPRTTLIAKMRRLGIKCVLPARLRRAF